MSTRILAGAGGPERHDLVLSKLIRASAADLQVCKEIHERQSLDVDTLLGRHLDEMRYAIGSQSDRDMAFIAGVEYLWDVDTADVVEQRLQRSRHARGERR